MKAKKNLRVIVAYVIVLLLLEGCYYNGITPSLVGSWNLVSVVYSECTNTGYNGTSTCTLNCLNVFTATAITHGSSVINYILIDDKITISNVYGGTRDGTYKVNGNILVITFQDTIAEGGCKEVVTFTKV